jgi:MFS family permease
MSGGPATAPGKPRLSLWVAVFSAPALRTALLGGLLVAEAAIGTAFGLGGSALAILVECSIFGGLLAVILLPILSKVLGMRALSLGAAVAAIVFLAAGMVFAPKLSPGTATIAVLYGCALLLGFFVALLSPITQVLLNKATANDKERHSLQSTWSAGLPAGFIAASVIGGILVEWFGWWTALAVPLAFALVSAIALLGSGFDTSEETGAEDLPPSIREVAAIVVALVAFEIWSTWGSLGSWLEPRVVLALLATVGTGAYAIAKLRRSQNPPISLEPFAVGGFGAAALVLFLYQLPTTAEFEVLLLTELKHLPAEAIGDRTAIGNAGQVAGTMLAAGLLYRKQIRLALVAGFGLTLAGLAAYTIYPWVDGFFYIAATRTVTGLGGGLLTPVLFVVALDRMPGPAQLAAGTWLVLASIGGVELGLALFDAVQEMSSLISGSTLIGYLSVELAQLALGVAIALLAVHLVTSGRLSTRVGM